MDAVMESLQGLGAFALYFSISLVALVVFKFLYTLVTPHDEWALVKEQKNTAAALGLGGAVLGFSIALAGAASNAVDLIDFGVWAIVALIAQVVAFALVRFIYMPKIVTRIENDEVSAGIVLAGISIAIGILNAACMTY